MTLDADAEALAAVDQGSGRAERASRAASASLDRARAARGAVRARRCAYAASENHSVRVWRLSRSRARR